MAASSTATDGTTAAYDTAAYGTPHNKDPCPLQQGPFQDYLPTVTARGTVRTATSTTQKSNT